MRSDAQPSTQPTVRHSHSMQGSYANWTVTLTADAVDDEDPIDVPEEVVAAVTDAFDTAVNHYELSRDVERLGRKLG